MTRNSLRFALATLLAAGCEPNGTLTDLSSSATSPSFSRTAQHFRTVEQLEISDVDLCTGEPFTVVGEARVSQTLVFDETGTLLHETFTVHLDAVGTSSISGTKLHFISGNQIVSQSRSGSDPALITLTGKVIGRLVTQGPAVNHLFDFIIHVTVTGQGVEKVTVDRESFVCHG